MGKNRRLKDGIVTGWSWRKTGAAFLLGICICRSTAAMDLGGFDVDVLPGESSGDSSDWENYFSKNSGGSGENSSPGTESGSPDSNGGQSGASGLGAGNAGSGGTISEGGGNAGADGYRGGSSGNSGGQNGGSAGQSGNSTGQNGWNGGSGGSSTGQSGWNGGSSGSSGDQNGGNAGQSGNDTGQNKNNTGQSGNSTVQNERNTGSSGSNERQGSGSAGFGEGNRQGNGNAGYGEFSGDNTRQERNTGYTESRRERINRNQSGAGRDAEGSDHNRMDGRSGITNNKSGDGIPESGSDIRKTGTEKNKNGKTKIKSGRKGISQAPVPTAEPAFFDPESADAEKEKKSPLEIYYYKKRFASDGVVPEITIRSDGPVQILSVRINEQECDWKWGEAGLILSSEDLSEAQKSDSDIWAELLLLHEKGTEVTVSVSM